MSLITNQTRYQPRRPAHKIEEPSQPWTTARCHRLLRPLISRIASMRKEISMTGQATASTIKSGSGTIVASSTNRNGHHEQPDSESGWLMPRKKRPRLTYSQRRSTQSPQSHNSSLEKIVSGQNGHEDTSLAAGTKSGVRKTFRCIQPERQQKATAPGEIVPSTPILRRARGKVMLSPIASVHELDLDPNQAELGHERLTKTGSNAQKRLDERLNSLRDRFCSKYTDLEAIYRSFEALLKATAASTIGNVRVARGPRSFLDMCLWRVPQYIMELEAWERFDAEQTGTVSTLDDIDTSAQIYYELESLGTNVGWGHLRVVVRADGLNAVKHAIEEGLFDDEFSQLIIDLCVQLGAASEAEDLVAALVHRQYPQPVSTESRFTQVPALKPLATLNSFAGQTQRTSFLFRQYSMLLSSGNLPTDWLATSEFEQIWALAVQEMANNHPNHDVISFIAQSILLLCCQKRFFKSNNDITQLEQDMARASQRTLMSALSILASMSLLGETRIIAPGLPESDTRQVEAIGDRFKHVIRTCINGLKGHTRGRGTQRLETLYLVLFLSSLQDQGEKVESHVKGSLEKLSPPIVTSLSTKDIRMQNHYDNIAWLVASIARACGRATSVASHQCLHGLLERLESLKVSQNLLDKLKAAAAFLIAQQTNNVKDLIYAEGLHPHARLSSGTTSQQQSGNTLFTGYRWEETIGEWVTVSPVANKRRAPAIKKHLRSSTPPKGIECSLTRPSSPTSSITDRLPDAGPDLVQGMDDGENDANKRIQDPYEGRSMMMRKRPRRLRSAETLTAQMINEVLLPQQSLAIPASSRPSDSQADPEKENCVRLLAKKPRRSSARMVLGARSLSRDPIERRDTYSDDELCI
ncbi:hypothetical protein F5Y12DRAFT_715920 [Xylaria sp. FL1777]|nr:hypothetical protein F5Y12DRAFT_715920 [Xylaria sp. FL1777]